MAISERAESAEPSDISPWVGQRMTLDEFLALPEEKPALEYDDGAVTQKMAAKPIHASIQGFLYAVINQIARPKRVGLAFTEARFVTPGWAPVPDVVFYRRGRGGRGDGPLPEDFTEPPDIAVEILSPEQRVVGQLQKCVRYLSVGVPIVVFIDPTEQMVMLLRTDRSPDIYQADDLIQLTDVLPGFDVTVRAMFEAVAPEWFAQAKDDEDAASDASAESAEGQ
jgi:Uma2 family endonuclease